jgi:two-component system invasion response regulator UvrY
MNLLIVDDHDVIRQSLGMIIQSELPSADFSKCHSAESCIEALKKDAYDLIILDMNLPDMDGISLTEWILSRYPQQMILVFSMNPASVFAKKLYQMGVMGFLNKQANMNDIRKALRTILLDKKQYLSDEFKSIIAQDMLSNQPANPVEKLSKRELTIAQLIAQGKTFDEIAKQLHIEASTIRTYKARIFNKLDVTTLHEFLAKAVLYKIA